MSIQKAMVTRALSEIEPTCLDVFPNQCKVFCSNWILDNCV